MSKSAIPPRLSRLLAKHTVQALLSLIYTAGHISSLPVPAAARAVRVVTDGQGHLPSACHHHNLVVALPQFQHWLRSWHAPTGARTVTYKPPQTILVAYGAVHALLVLDEKSRAFELFSVLTQNHHIPAEFFRHVRQEGEGKVHDFEMIIRSVLAHACVHWGWHRLAMELIMAMMKTLENQAGEEAKRKFVSRVFDLLHTALGTCSADQLRHCAALMCSLVRDAQGLAIPDATVELFYHRARCVQDAPSAARFYRCTQSRKALSRARYHPPGGSTFVWLLKYLVEERHDVHLARSLTKQLLNFSVLIPPNERGAVVAMAAKSGFATSARALWEQYAVGPERELVIGNAGTMIRMISLFQSLVSRTQLKLDALQGCEDSEQRMVTEAKLADLTQFTQRVLLAFHECKEPLETATHQDLNALARAYFLVGRIQQGLIPYRALLRRREIPDVYDINVALSAVARYSPRMAATMVERMMRVGLRPDAVTFGTVVHEALVQGDVELAGGLVEQARACGLEALSGKTIAALVRVGVGEGDAGDEMSLQHVWDIVQATPKKSVVHSANLGKSCVAASVRAGDAQMAFGFWDTLVRRRAEWGDREQVRLRGTVAELVQRRVRDGTLGQERGQEMLRALLRR